jgi:hypothetical protein
LNVDIEISIGSEIGYKNTEEWQNMGLYMIHKEKLKGKMVRKHKSQVETNLVLQ